MSYSHFIIYNRDKPIPVEDLFNWFGNFYKFRVSKYYRGIARFNYRFYRVLDLLRSKRICIKRIIKVEYLVISKHFVIWYKKRHYNREGVFLFKY